MIQVNEELTRQVAKLARLKLSPAEVSMFTPQLSQIIHYIEKLQEVDVQGVLPLLHPIDLPTAFREDQVSPSPLDAEGRPKVLQSAPEVVEGGFSVPPIL